MTFAETLKHWRSRRGLTQCALAQRMQVSQAFIAQLETAAYNPTLATLRRVAQALKVTPTILLNGRRG